MLNIMKSDLRRKEGLLWKQLLCDWNKLKFTT